MLPSQDFIILWIFSLVNIFENIDSWGYFFSFCISYSFSLENLEIHMHTLSIVEQKHSECLCKIMKINSPDSFSSMGRYNFLLLGVHLVIYKSVKSDWSRFISWLYYLTQTMMLGKSVNMWDLDSSSIKWEEERCYSSPYSPHHIALHAGL